MQVQEKFKILYSLEEIMQNGYLINTTIPKEKRCPYCNKVLELLGVEEAYLLNSNRKKRGKNKKKQKI